MKSRIGSEMGKKTEWRFSNLQLYIVSRARVIKMLQSNMIA